MTLTMEAKDPLTSLAVDVPYLSVRTRNALADSIFYDVGSLTAEEQGQLSPLNDREGSIVVVPPSGRGRIRHYRSALRFMHVEGDQIRALAVAGVGSSVVGTVALARNVADAMDCDVAGVVTGYGLTDLVAEALGGWFLFGAADRTRMRVEQVVETSRSVLGGVLPAAAVGRNPQAVSLSARPGPDVATILDILVARPKNLNLVVGHSKGSLMLDYAMEQFVRDLDGDSHPLFDSLHVVTLGAVVDFPDQFKHVKQFMGSRDWFGGLNSRRGLERSVVPKAWHHLNRKLPHHLDAVAVLKEYLDENGLTAKAAVAVVDGSKRAEPTPAPRERPAAEEWSKA
ncbi:hypothetical protein [Geodermatophilus sp. CPCC 205506]|uniref:hypothetical protein n=1 Tax=Geodermatophilus sp. CPCC 205506 TaxID=2936596 RepID=UPI003EEA3324